MNKWHYDSIPTLDPACASAPDLPRERDPLIDTVRSVVAIIIRALLRVYNRFEIIGRENLRTNRPLVIVANHCSHLDTICLQAALPLRKLHRTFPAAAADYFFVAGARRWIAEIITNAVPFARQTQTRKSLAVCASVLQDPRNVLIMFPEGTRSLTGQIQPFKSGIGALVAGRDVEVVPCFIDGSFRVWPKGSNFPRPGKVRLVIGSPRNFRSCAAEKGDVARIAGELHAAVNRLSGQNGRH